jgi:hypothetical protein
VLSPDSRSDNTESAERTRQRLPAPLHRSSCVNHPACSSFNAMCICRFEPKTQLLFREPDATGSLCSVDARAMPRVHLRACNASVYRGIGSLCG